MTGQNRRQFLGLAGKAVAATTALAAFPDSIARALALPARRRARTIEDVQHVVILMQENRSFDHYFGTMNGVRGFGDRFPIPLPGGRTVFEQSDGERVVLPYHLDETTGNAQRVDGTPHSWRDSQDAWDGGRMSEWALHKEPHSMGYFTEQEIPYQWALADAFTLCDAYHCSIQAGTNPNRLFLWTGSNGPVDNVAAVVNEWDYVGPVGEGYDWTTYPERLEEAGVTWKVYQFMPDNFGDNSLQGFRNFRLANDKMGNGPDGAPFVEYDPSFDAVDPLIKGVGNTMPDGGFLEALRADIAAGTLPQVSWIVAPAEYSEHPGPSSPTQGGSYTEAVLDALTADPDVWAGTVLLVNYDENDGYFDHMPPPAAPSLSEDGESTGESTLDIEHERFVHPNPPGTVGQPAPDGGVYGLGPRVPLLVISPWSRGGWVDSQVFDHTSVIRFLEARFGVDEPNISPWRRSVAGDLTSAFDFTSPDAEAVDLPAIGKSRADRLRADQEALAQVPIPPPFEQVLPAQAVGTRPSRALPYDLDVSADVDGGTGSVALSFTNSGDVGAVYHVYDRLHLDRLPRRYTVGAGEQLAGEWDTLDDGGAYDLWLLGPNGFHRSFLGQLAVDADEEGEPIVAAEQRYLPQLTARRSGRDRAVELVLGNDGTEPLTFVVGPNEYRDDAPASIDVSPGATATVTWDAEDEDGWYDVTVAVDEHPAFERRLAGRLDDGTDTTSDPAMGG